MALLVSSKLLNVVRRELLSVATAARCAISDQCVCASSIRCVLRVAWRSRLRLTDEVEAVQAVIATRQSKLLRKPQPTREYHRLGAINGIVLDADGTTTIRNFYTEFGITLRLKSPFSWSNKTDVTGFIRQNVIRPMVQALGGRWCLVHASWRCVATSSMMV